MHNLRPAILEQGLVAALQWMASRYERRTGTECVLHTSHDALQLPPGIALVAYRTAQEALTNARRHAPGAPVDVHLDRQPESLTLTVRNGPGRGPATASPGSGLGLVGMRERAAQIGATVTAGPITEGDQAGGWSVVLTLPAGGEDTDIHRSTGENR